MVKENQGDDLGHQDKKQIKVKLASKEDRVFELKDGARLISIIEIVAAELGCGVEELVLFRDGEAQPLTEAVLVDATYPHKRRHHVHRASDVTVVIYYQSQAKTNVFKRNTTIGTILLWAINEFKVDATMATELELSLHDRPTEELPEDEHIGHLARHQNELSLDLVRGDIANGG